MRLKLSCPRKITFLVATAIAILTLLGKIALLPISLFYGYGLQSIAFIILMVAVLLDNLWAGPLPTIRSQSSFQSRNTL